MKKLVIISHTDHQTDPELGIVGWGPTVNEINHLATGFDQIVHVACKEDRGPRGGSLPYSDARITLKPIDPFGGTTLFEKLSILWHMPRVIAAVREAIKGATHVQLRLPMGIGIYLIPLFSLRGRRPYILWVKYANDWGQRKPPLGYAVQRWMLRRNFARCKVTINGFWENQHSHCISFENPCLKETEIEQGREVLASKSYVKPYTFAFVGRLEDAKGVSRIIEAFREIEQGWISKIHFIGDGQEIESFRRKASFLGDKAEFHGFCRSDKVREVLRTAHFFLLPTTASEGFPKAVAEAACFGAIPIVSNVSSIAHYVEDGRSGFVWDPAKEHFQKTLEMALETDENSLARMAAAANRFSALFTFERYSDRLESEIFRR